MKLPPEMREPFAAAVRAAAERGEVRRAVEHLYTAVQDALDLRRPVCNASGRCCRFDEFGHRLFVTTIELGAFLGNLPAARLGPLSRVPGRRDQPAAPSPAYAAERDGAKGQLLAVDEIPEMPPGGCPFQIDGLCSVHTIRPFGCRIFFCDETAADWQQEQYARFHAELKRLHAVLGVDYYYVEWREALGALAAMGF
jgi:Fe-S-cluster containining protein